MSTEGPTFFIVGNPKSGTTALDAMLRQHPDLFLGPKDAHHFAVDLDRAEHGPFRTTSRAQHLAAYQDAAPHQVLGDASACYTISEVAIERIAATVPEAKVIVGFREPVAYLRSWHLQLLRDPRLETEHDLERAIELETDRRQGRHLPRRCVLPELLRYSEMVRYAEQLRRIQAAFPAEQVHVLLHDDLVRDPRRAVAEIFAFLGVDPDVAVEPEARNVGVSTTSSTVEDLRNRVIAGRPGDAAPVRLASRLLYALPEQRLHALNRQAKRVLHRPPPPLDRDLVQRLRTRFRPEVDELARALDVDLVARWWAPNEAGGR